MIPQNILDKIREREGFKSESYRDTKGLLTAGVGHLLNATEAKLYPIGMQIPESVTSAWLEQDTQKAYNAAREQAACIGFESDVLIEALTLVSFQLGVTWAVKFPATWHLLMKMDWAGAAKEAERSFWAKQTPVRYHDFRDLLLSLASKPLSLPTESISEQA